jgi:hypothetical protein
MLLIDNNLLLPGAKLNILINIYRNDHRHHHKFIKYEKQLRKEGNMLGLPSIKRPYLRGKQTQILRGQQRGNGSATMISMTMQFIIINLKRNIESIHF